MVNLGFFSSSLDNLSVDERLYKDVQDWVFQRIRESVPIQKNITPANASKPEDVKTTQTNFAHYVIQASRGNFLYVDLVLNFFKEGKLQVKSSSFGMIPTTLSEVFLLAFNLKYPTHEAFLKVSQGHNYYIRVLIHLCPYSLGQRPYLHYGCQPPAFVPSGLV